jgi:hypothetical protein
MKTGLILLFALISAGCNGEEIAASPEIDTGIFLDAGPKRLDAGLPTVDAGSATDASLSPDVSLVEPPDADMPPDADAARALLDASIPPDAGCGEVNQQCCDYLDSRGKLAKMCNPGNGTTCMVFPVTTTGMTSTCIPTSQTTNCGSLFKTCCLVTCSDGLLRMGCSSQEDANGNVLVCIGGRCCHSASCTW